MRYARPLLCAALFPLLVSCGPRGKKAGAPTVPPPFEDVADAAGIAIPGSLPSHTLNILETAGSGGAFLDAGGDGRLDILLVGKNFCRLFRNRDGVRFEEVTAAARLPQKGHYIGCAAADADGDGDVDIFLNGYGIQRLLLNDGAGRFTDVTRAAGLLSPSGSPQYGTSAAWGDYDGDGRLDLYAARFVDFRPGMPELCPGRMQTRGTCPPDRYAAQRGVLYRNLGGARFRDVTEQTGAGRISGKSWGCLWWDYNADGRQDLYLANDEVPGDLLQNLGGRFRNVGVPSGTAFDAEGRVHGGMGVDSGDYDGDGLLDLVVTTFISEPYNLYRSDDGHTFTEVSGGVGLARPTYAPSGWGVRLFDWDNDGRLDLFFANGHATDSTRHTGKRDHGMAMPMQLFRNEENLFVPVDLKELSAPLIARGAAFGDFDDDGFTDILVMTLPGRPLLLRNLAARRSRNAWIGVNLSAPGPNPQALGARVTLRSAGRSQVAEVRTCGSIFSSHDPRLRFGLGSETSPCSVEIRWPGAAKIERWENLPPGRYHHLRQGSGLLTAPPDAAPAEE